jgi:hypothetical protein
VKREFKRAGLLARQAVCLTKDVFDKDHPKYSDSLLDFGFFLLNFDSIRQSVGVYEVSSMSHTGYLTNFNTLKNSYLKMTVFWDVAPCSLIEIDQCFRGAYCFHHQ